MTHHYYIGEGQESEAMVSDVQKAIHQERDKALEIAKSYGAVTCAVRNGNVFGICFPDGEADTQKHLKPGPMMKDTDEKRLRAYIPKINTKAGKELSQKLRTVANLNFSDRVISKLGIGRMDIGIIGGRPCLFHSVAGYCSGKLLVKIPAVYEDSKNGSGDPMPAVPNWLREVKESEWLAAQGK